MILKIVIEIAVAILVGLLIGLYMNRRTNKQLEQLEEMEVTIKDLIDEPREIEVTADKLVVDQPNNIMKMKFTLYRPRKGFNPPIDKKEVILETPYNNFNPGSDEELHQALTSILADLMEKNGYTTTTMTYQEFQNFDLKEEENMKIAII